MPLIHRDAAFIPERVGVWFVLTDPDRKDVLCLAEPDALSAAAKECGMVNQSVVVVFNELRPAIETCASDKYDRVGLAPDAAVHVCKKDLLAA